MAIKNDLKIDDDLVRTLAALLDETGLSEIEYAVGDKRIRVARGNTTTVAMTAPAAAPVTAAAPAAAPTADHPGALKSPMVGTVYLRPQPGAALFVQPGDTVREGQTLLIIEAMKVMNQIPAPRAGKVTQVLVTDGTPIEFGQVLVVIE